jgi:hypothetical protein
MQRIDPALDREIRRGHDPQQMTDAAAADAELPCKTSLFF